MLFLTHSWVAARVFALATLLDHVLVFHVDLLLSETAKGCRERLLITAIVGRRLKVVGRFIRTRMWMGHVVRVAGLVTSGNHCLLLLLAVMRGRWSRAWLRSFLAKFRMNCDWKHFKTSAQRMSTQKFLTHFTRRVPWMRGQTAFVREMLRRAVLLVLYMPVSDSGLKKSRISDYRPLEPLEQLTSRSLSIHF